MRWQLYWEDIKKSFPHLSEERQSLMAKIANPKFSTKDFLPEAVSQDPGIQELHDKRLNINFKHFNQRKCDFSSIDEVSAASIIDKLKLITETALGSMKNLGIKDSVERNSENREYNYLFDNIPFDVERIQEMPFSYGGRIFCFWNEGADFYIVSIKTKHINQH